MTHRPDLTQRAMHLFIHQVTRGLLGGALLLSSLSCQPSCISSRTSSRTSSHFSHNLSQDAHKSKEQIERRTRGSVSNLKRGGDATKVPSEPQQNKVSEPHPSPDQSHQSALWASDRIWGHLSLPEGTVRQLNQLWSAPPEQFKVVIYGDSHTQGGYLGAALAEELSTLIDHKALKVVTPLLDEAESPPNYSPGWVTVDHPIHSRARVHKEGQWIRQNWLYRSDQGPFGPLGIAFVTQDQSAELRVLIDPKSSMGHLGVEVSVYFEQTGQELPFCLRAIPRKSDSKSSSGSASSPQAHEQSSRLPTQACHRPGAPSSSVAIPRAAELQRGVELDHERGQSQGQESSSDLGHLKIWVPPHYEAHLSLRDGERVSEHLMRKRESARRSLKRKRRRLKKRYRGLSRAELNEKLSPPSYARNPALVLPNKPSLRVFGFQVHDPQSRVEVSSLGVRGATIWSPVEQADSSLERWIRHSKPHLIALWYGTNTAARETTHLPRYRQRYQAFIQRLKSAAPESVCLVILPPDFGRRNRECFLTKRQRKLIARRRKSKRFKEELSESRRARVCAPDELLNLNKRGRRRFPVPEAKTMTDWERYKESCHFAPPSLLIELIEIQKEVALQEGCAVYDTFNAMGGAGGIKDWACAEGERWAQLDLVHLTSSGYQNLGARIAHGLYSTQSASPIPPPPLAPPPPPEEPLKEPSSEEPLLNSAYSP